MRSPTYALIWEQWRLFGRIYLALAVSEFVGALCLVPSTQSEVFRFIGYLLFFAPPCLMFLTAIFAHSTASDLGFRLPLRLYTLPIRRGQIVTAQLAFRLICLLSLALPVATFAAQDKLNRFSEFTSMLLFIAGLFVYCQAIGWTVGRYSAVLAIVVMILLPLPVSALGEWVGVPGELFLLVLPFVTLAVCYWAGMLPPTRVSSLSRLAPRIDPNFIPIKRSSPKSRFWAQCWFEWHARWKILPLLFLAFYGFFSISVFAKACIFDRSGIINPLVHTLQTGAVAMPVLLYLSALAAGMRICGSGNRKSPSSGWNHSSILPMTTSKVSAARLSTAFVALLSTYLIASVYQIMLDMPMDDSTMFTLSGYVAPLHLFMLWTLLIVPKTFLLAALLQFILIANPFGYFPVSPVLILIGLLSSACIFCVVLRWRWSNVNPLPMLAIFGACTTIFLVSEICQNAILWITPIGQDIPATVFAIFVTALFSILVVPLRIEMLRHGRTWKDLLLLPTLKVSI